MINMKSLLNVNIKERWNKKKRPEKQQITDSYIFQSCNWVMPNKVNNLECKINAPYCLEVLKQKKIQYKLTHILSGTVVGKCHLKTFLIEK